LNGLFVKITQSQQDSQPLDNSIFYQQKHQIKN